MMGVEPGTHGVRYGMHAAEALLEGGGAHRCSSQHLGARFYVFAVSTGTRQESLNEAHAFERDAIRERVKSRRAKRFEAVDEGVDTGSGSHAARQPDGQFRIGYDDARHHQRMENDLFLVRLLVEDDARSADFRARSRGGRNGNDRRDAGWVGALPPVTDVLEIPQRARLS